VVARLAAGSLAGAAPRRARLTAVLCSEVNRMLTLIDKNSRQGLAVKVAKKLRDGR
jgi:hypothetical protein